jgi:CRP-like cAMP-binding protein
MRFMELAHVLQRMTRKFARRASLDEGDKQALMALPFTRRIVEAGRYIVREGDLTQESVLLISGFAFRHKMTADGERQIVSIHIPGDFVDLEGALLKVADHSVQALTRAEIATIPRERIIALIDSHPRVGRAMWIDTLVDGSIYREWVMNVGRRQAKERIGHLLCEFARRLEIAGLGDTSGYELPMTQEQLADATGLTSVHVNRTLKALEAEGLIVRNKRFIKIPDWERLRDLSGFNELYLHLDQAA